MLEPMFVIDHDNAYFDTKCAKSRRDRIVNIVSQNLKHGGFESFKMTCHVDEHFF